MARCIIDRCQMPLRISEKLAISVFTPLRITNYSGSVVPFRASLAPLFVHLPQ